MTAPSREWVTIPVPGKERKQWQIDVTFLMSSWRCIFGQGCQGVLTEPASEMIEGCCSYGAHESEVKVKDTYTVGCGTDPAAAGEPGD